MSIIKLTTLSLALILNFLIFFNFYSKYIYEEEHNVKDLTKDIVDSIDLSLKRYIISLRNIQALFNIKNEISEKDFLDYSNAIQFKKNYIGSLGFGFIRLVREEDLKEYIKLNNNVFIHPIVKAKEHMIIEFIEPAENNPNTKWLDLAYDYSRKDSALTSAIKNDFILTRPLNLSQLYEKSLGFYAFLPIFDPKGKNPKYFLKGWAFTTIVLEKFLKELDAKIPNNVKIQIEFDNSDLMYTGGFSKNISNSKIYKNYSETTKIIGGYNWKITLISDSEKVINYIILLFILYIIANVILTYSSIKIINIITAKNKMLYQKESWFKGVINSSNYLIISTDSDGKILSFNTSAEKNLQYKANEIIGKETPLIFHDINELKTKFNQQEHKFIINNEHNLNENLSNLNNLFDYFVSNLDKINLSQNQWSFIRKDGSKFFVKLLISSIFNQYNNIIGYLFTAEDLSHEMEIQKIINEQKEQMLYTSKFSQLGEMAANIAHEINTPLSIILMKSYSLKTKITEKNVNYDDFISDISKIENTTQKIARIVKSLKMYTRNSENDKFEKVNLTNVIQSTLDLCSEKLTNNSIKLIYKNNKIFYTFGKEAELCQVFLNLINNSIDAIAPMSDKWIQIEINQNESILQLRFTDCGGGIPIEIVNNLMKPFFTTKQVGKGTGLGLSISKRIIEMHKGKLYYDRSNKNTSFIIELPSII